MVEATDTETEPSDNLSEAEKVLADTIDAAVRDALDAGVSLESVLACLDAHQVRIRAHAVDEALDRGEVSEDEVPDELLDAQELLEADADHVEKSSSVSDSSQSERADGGA